VLIGAASFGSGFCTSGVQKGGNALSIYFYPTALRSTGLGWGLGIGRIGAIVGPLAVGYLLTSGWSAAAVFCAMAVPMLVGATAIVAMGRAYGIGPLVERAVHAGRSAGDAQPTPIKA
jgi:AAHS family 4-hydroxybenzoate transporter-like MFS transporter